MRHQPILALAFTIAMPGCSALFDFPVKPELDTDTTQDTVDDTTDDTGFDVVPDTGDDAPSDPGVEDVEEEPVPTTPCAINGAGTRLSVDDASMSWEQVVEWTGSEFGVFWQDGRNCDYEIYFARVGPDGSAIGSEIPVVQRCANEGEPSAAWNGSEYGLVWDDDSDVYFSLVQADGTALSSGSLLASGDGEMPRMVWTSSEFMVLRRERYFGYASVSFTRTSGNGTPIDDGMLRETTADILDYTIAWSGSALGLAWTEGPSGAALMFQLVTPLGNPVGAPRMLTAYTVRYPSMDWTGSEWIIAWQDDRDGTGPSSNEIYLTRISADGAETRTEVRVTETPSNSVIPSIGWTGSEMGLLWCDWTSGETDSLWFARVHPDGTLRDEPVGIGTCEQHRTSMVYNGTNFGAAVMDGSMAEIFFHLIGFCEI